MYIKNKAKSIRSLLSAEAKSKKIILTFQVKKIIILVSKLDIRNREASSRLRGKG